VGPSPSKVVIVPTEPVSIAFYAVRGGAADIYTVPPAGGKLTNVTGDDPADSDPKWSPNGQRLVFDSRRDDGHRNIWIREFDGSYNRVTNDANSNNAFPTWSPDGMKIAYVHDGEIWARDFAAGTLRQLTAGADDSRPSWSNKDVIAFHRTTPGNHEIFTVPADGSAPAKALIAKGAGGGRQPSWSPDGTKLAYSKLLNGVLRIVVARANGTSGKTITPGSPCPCQFPTWSPDGNQIAFQAGPAGKEQIYVVGATGGTVKRVTDGKAQNLAPGWGT
jgi:TolB protein